MSFFSGYGKLQRAGFGCLEEMAFPDSDLRRKGDSVEDRHRLYFSGPPVELIPWGARPGMYELCGPSELRAEIHAVFYNACEESRLVRALMHCGHFQRR